MTIPTLTIDPRLLQLARLVLALLVAAWAILHSR